MLTSITSLGRSWLNALRVPATRRPRRSARWIESLEDRQLLTVNIVFDYTYDDAGFMTAERKATMEAAGRLFEDAFSDDLAAITPTGINTWSAIFDDPETGTSVSLTDITIPADEIRIYVGARALAGSQVGEASTGFSWSGTSAWGDAVEYRGEAVVSTETAPWGGSIAFDSTATWHDGFTTEGLTGSETDFYSVAVHEIGHILGIASSSGGNAWTANINGSGFFVGPNIVAVAGAGGVATTGGHFADGVMSDGKEVAMSPSHLDGVRHPFTTYDWAAMDDIGWTLTFDESSATPKPGHLAIQVVDENGAVLSGETVTLVSVSGTGSANTSTGTTDSLGIFSSVVTGGSWDIRVDNTVSRVTVRGGSEQVEVNLIKSSVEDVFGWDLTTGRWRMGESSGTRFTNRSGTLLNLTAGWTFQKGDFNGDGKVDYAGLTSTGQWWVGTSNGTNFSNSFWLKWSPVATAGWKNFQVGDFNDDGRDDIAAQTTGGYWWVAISTGTSFDSEYWGRWADSGWTDIVSGDFNNDGKDELAGLRTNGDWYFGLSDGTKFTQSYAGRWSGTAGWQDIRVGDFDGDGRDDLFGRTSDGYWWVGKSTGSSLSTVYGTRWIESDGWSDVVIGDFNGDGKADIAGRKNSGEWNVATSTGTRLSNKRWGIWNSTVTWSVVVGDFDGDGKDDIAGRVAATGEWWVALSQSSLLFSNTYFGSWGAGASAVTYQGSGEIG